VEGDLYEYPIKIYQGDIFAWDIHRDPLHNFFSNIKVDI
jgi:hypothetical protein